MAPIGVSDDKAAPVDQNRSPEDATATKYLPDEVIAVAVEGKPTPDDWQAVNLASTFVQHAETIAQTRFNNFLVADSLLLLAWATLFAGKQSDGSKYALFTLAGLSAVLGFFSLILGNRQGKFFELHSRHLVTLERSLPSSVRIGGTMQAFRDGKEGPIGSQIGSQSDLRLGRIEKWITPTRFNKLGTGVLILISLILVLVTGFGL